MFSQPVINHFVNSGLDPENMDKETIDEYFKCIKNPEGVYLPDESLSPFEKAIGTLSQLAAQYPDEPVALTRFEQEDVVYTAVSFLIERETRIDFLFPFAPSFEGTVWITPATATEMIYSFVYGTDFNKEMSVVEVDAPAWADGGFLLLFGVPPVGVSSIGGVYEHDETPLGEGALQRAASCVFTHHVLNAHELTNDERAAIEGLLGATFEGKTIPVGLLLKIGELNPFATNESVVARNTAAGTVLLGESVTLGPLVQLAAPS